MSKLLANLEPTQVLALGWCGGCLFVGIIIVIVDKVFPG